MAYGIRRLNDSPIIPTLRRINQIGSTHIHLRSILLWFLHLALGLPRDLLPEGLPIKILKALLPSSILTTSPAHLKIPVGLPVQILKSFLPFFHFRSHRKKFFNSCLFFILLIL